jgi:hypothetical protein
MQDQATAPAPGKQLGCLSVTWLMIKLPFMIIGLLLHPGDLLRGEAAMTMGKRARVLEALTPAADPAAVTAALAQVSAHDPGFDFAATTRGVARAREIVAQARQQGDADSARLVLSDGLWRVFRVLLANRAVNGVSRHGTSEVVRATLVAATRDQLAEQLRIRLACRGERYEVTTRRPSLSDPSAQTTWVLRGTPGEQTTWDEDWIIRRSARATTPAGGGVLSGKCPNCGAALDLDPGGACTYCHALALTGGQDWVVWSMEEGPW